MRTGRCTNCPARSVLRLLDRSLGREYLSNCLYRTFVRSDRQRGADESQGPSWEAAIVTTVRVPKAGGVTSTKAVVVQWLKRPGDSVKVGEPLVELETEKVTYELESPAEGVLLKVIAEKSVEVPVGDPLCQIG